MPYKLYVGDTSSKIVTFNDFKNAIGDADAGRVSLIGGQTEIREMVDPSEYSIAKQQQWSSFITDAVRFYLLYFQSLDEAQATQDKLEKSDLPVIFFLGTHGSGDPP